MGGLSQANVLSCRVSEIIYLIVLQRFLECSVEHCVIVLSMKGVIEMELLCMMMCLRGMDYNYIDLDNIYINTLELKPILSYRYFKSQGIRNHRHRPAVYDDLICVLVKS